MSILSCILNFYVTYNVVVDLGISAITEPISVKPLLLQYTVVWEQLHICGHDSTPNEMINRLNNASKIFIFTNMKLDKLFLLNSQNYNSS